jgi:hypothetical protein
MTSNGKVQNQVWQSQKFNRTIACPLWLKSGHRISRHHVRYSPESGTVHCFAFCRSRERRRRRAADRGELCEAAGAFVQLKRPRRITSGPSDYQQKISFQPFVSGFGPLCVEELSLQPNEPCSAPEHDHKLSPRPLNAIIDLGNTNPDLGGSHRGMGVEIRAGLSGGEPAPI